MTLDLDQMELSLNPTIESLTALIGEELLQKLSVDLGGKRVSIPLKARPHSPLAVSIGIAAAQKISHVYGGMDVNIPVRQAVRSRIIALRAEGKSASEIAHIVLCHRST